MDKFALRAGAVAATFLATARVLAADASQPFANATIYRNMNLPRKSRHFHLTVEGGVKWEERHNRVESTATP
jgi:hypothetical protein